MHCKRPASIPAELKEVLEANHVEMRPDQNFIYMPSGCPECMETGYRGRVALMEMCVIDSQLGDMIARNAPQGEMRKVAQASGVLSLYQEGLIQVLAGQTTLEEIRCLSYTSATY